MCLKHWRKALEKQLVQFALACVSTVTIRKERSKEGSKPARQKGVEMGGQQEAQQLLGF